MSIVCAEDRVVDPAWSRRVARDRLGVEPIELPGGHSPFLAPTCRRGGRPDGRPLTIRSDAPLAGQDGIREGVAPAGRPVQGVANGIHPLAACASRACSATSFCDQASSLSSDSHATWPGPAGRVRVPGPARSSCRSLRAPTPAPGGAGPPRRAAPSAAPSAGASRRGHGAASGRAPWSPGRPCDEHRSATSRCTASVPGATVGPDDRRASGRWWHAARHESDGAGAPRARGHPGQLPASPPNGWVTTWASPSGPPAATSPSCARPTCPSSRSRGPHGGYRVGRGLRLPPLMFTAAEALGPRHGRARGAPWSGRPDRARRGRPVQDPPGAPPAGRRAGPGRPSDHRAAARPEPARRPAPDGQARRGLHVGAAGADRLPARGRTRTTDGGGPVGGRPAPRSLVPPRLVAHERCPARPPGRPRALGLPDVTAVHPARRTSTRSAPSRSTSRRGGGTRSTCSSGPTSTRRPDGCRAASGTSSRSTAASGCGRRPTTPTGTPASSPSRR